MVSAKGPVLFNELHRLEALRGYEILDTPPEPAYDSITRLAATVLDVPIALIVLVDAQRQWFKSRFGLGADETPREVSFCAHAILDDGVMQVPDATKDPRFADNSLVTGEVKLRFYAGAPLISPQGFRLGTLCVIDRRPRPLLNDEQIARLTDLANLAMSELELHKLRLRLKRVKATEFHSLLSPPELNLLREARFGVLAAMAHEMRTPLNAVLGFGETMQAEIFGPLGNEKYLEYADCICRSGRHLLELVNNILDFARLEHGDLRPNDRPFSLPDLVDECFHIFVEESRRGDVALKARLMSDATHLKADRRLVGQILLNLIGNALKFTEPGGSITVAESRDASGGATVEIVDTGSGMSPRQIKAALRPYGRPGRTIKRGRVSGLGLPLSKRLMELHDGSLEIRSRPGAGTIVSLHFPPYRVQPDGTIAQHA